MNKTISIAVILALGMAGQIAKADYIFGTPTVIYPDFATAPSISTDGLSIYFDASDGYGGWEIWVSTRETVDDDWPAATKPTPPNSSYTDANPDISYDGLTLFFNSTRPGGSGDHDIWVSTRATINDPWGEPNNLGSIVNSPDYDGQPCISRDGLSLYLTSQRPGGSGDRDTYVSTRATKNDDWSEPQNLGPKVNSPSLDFGPDISSDGLTLFFSSERPGGYGRTDIWVTRRTTIGAAWSEAVNIGPPVNTSYNDYTPCISEDGSILYFYSYNRLRQASIIPIVDFNGDGTVDAVDLLQIALNLGTDNTLYDIGPTPLGDGVVDIEDVKVFIAEWEKQIATDLEPIEP